MWVLRRIGWKVEIGYLRIEQRACRLSSFLYSQGITKGDRVALLSPNHISYFDILFACGKLGAIFVPLNWRLSLPELSYVSGTVLEVDGGTVI